MRWMACRLRLIGSDHLIRGNQFQFWGLCPLSLFACLVSLLLSSTTLSTRRYVRCVVCSGCLADPPTCHFSATAVALFLVCLSSAVFNSIRASTLLPSSHAGVHARNSANSSPTSIQYCHSARCQLLSCGLASALPTTSSRISCSRETREYSWVNTEYLLMVQYSSFPPCASQPRMVDRV